MISNDNKLMEYFTHRRSVRKFKPEPIDDSIISSIVSQASKAPTTGNMQLYSVIVTRNPEQKSQLATLHFNQPATQAPVLLTICADFHRFAQWCKLTETHPGFNNLQGFLYGVFDATILAQQIATIAELRGLGTCMLGTTAFNAPEIASLLKLPSGVVPLLTIAVGTPDGEGEATERLPLEGILHWEEYSDPDKSRLSDIYSVKDKFPANIEYVKENNKASLAHVFTEIRYPEGMNQEFSEKLHKWLMQQGIDL